MMTTVAAEYDPMELHGQYSSSDTVNNRWDDEWDNENSSARLFERSRIKALAEDKLGTSMIQPAGWTGFWPILKQLHFQMK
ncbi:Spectrin beta chain, non-erythrocytic 1 [Ilyodon furcidens]|uniref:Spectrin beta chain, non-erythrocytic 1 n=1 Tax=Ilyodon furcidens TaxID=33524 RepID=A0ABV0TY20_9TELE